MLTSPEAAKEGEILGICTYCLKPVRSGQKYTVWREEFPAQKSPKFFKTFPSENEEIVFAHQVCGSESGQLC